jgi:hypothetical protein
VGKLSMFSIQLTNKIVVIVVVVELRKRIFFPTYLGINYL